MDQHCLIMGILNVTPDSFSDGGCYLKPEKAIAQARSLCDQGADLIDIGAESTRPGSEALTVEAEWRRLEPVLQALTQEGLGPKLSVDTSKPELMHRAIDLGVAWINDVTASAPDDVLKRAVDQGVGYLAMHMHGCPETMQNDPLDGRQGAETVRRFYSMQSQRLVRLGFQAGRYYLDPGIGFGKTLACNLQLLQDTYKLAKEYPLAVGISRKSFFGHSLGISKPSERDNVSKIAELGLMMAGVRVIRTHEVSRLYNLRQLLNEP